jgi:hypothetical protein
MDEVNRWRSLGLDLPGDLQRYEGLQQPDWDCPIAQWYRAMSGVSVDTLSIEVRSNGDYALQFLPDGTYVDGCYDSNSSPSYFTTDQNACTSVTVSTSDVTGINVAMPLGVHISGTVIGPDGTTPLANMWVSINVFSGASYQTDSNGHYSITVLPNVAHTLRFHDGIGTYVDGCYSSSISLGHFTTDPNACTPVPVGSEDVTLADVKMPEAGGGTPAGIDVPVVPDKSTGAPEPVSLAFSNVGEAGTTTLTTSPTPPAPLPTGDQLAGSATYYDLETTATYTGNITVCFSYAGITPVPTNLLHYENGEWTDITTSVDTTSQTICGTTTSLSPFALVTKIAPVALTITASSGTMTYGGAVPAFTPSYSGFVNGDTAASLTTAADLHHDRHFH